MSVVVRSMDEPGDRKEQKANRRTPAARSKFRRTLVHKVRTPTKPPPWDPKDSRTAVDAHRGHSGQPIPALAALSTPATRLGPLDPPGPVRTQSTDSGRHPDLAKWVHAQCSQQTQGLPSARRRACLPARFVVACGRQVTSTTSPRRLRPPWGRTDRASGAQASRCEIIASTLGPRVTVRCGRMRRPHHATSPKKPVAMDVGEATGLPGASPAPPAIRNLWAEQLRLMVIGASNPMVPASPRALCISRRRSQHGQ